ncbi:GUN4 domain protein [Rubidibacter lacunae KORDI 51-2]|uniref:GUN4 domain protein n=1 Tax=Rubidibacter lacunae KORDI 51-2 TaxID=582515 RepID=U5DLK6_9CHRO|nr:GUN4 domain-containing protein [Rubidibacter lacunae]ERN41767.1 GUN4 domain protein [Rubidibacter lacunae KORDI 51-2]
MNDCDLRHHYATFGLGAFGDLNKVPPMSNESETDLQPLVRSLQQELKQLREDQQLLRLEFDRLRNHTLSGGRAGQPLSPPVLEPNVPPVAAAPDHKKTEPDRTGGSRYSRLRSFLSDRKWKDADEETRRVMLEIVGREQEGWFDLDSIEQFPCDELRTIDQIWAQLTRGRFCFSVQKRIWLEVNRDYFAFGERIGWRENDRWLTYPQLAFHSNPNPPEGHLPVLRASGALLGAGSGIGTFRFSSLASRMIKCNL